MSHHKGGAAAPDLPAFCEALWRDADVRAACLELQDAHGADAVLALLAIALAARGRMADTVLAARTKAEAGAWSGAVTAPLRAARRALKDAAPDLYARALALEVDSERALLARLDAILAETPAAASPAGENLAVANLAALIGAAADTGAGRRLAQSGSAAAAAQLESHRAGSG